MKHENDETELITVPDNYLVINNTIGLNFKNNKKNYFVKI